VEERERQVLTRGAVGAPTRGSRWSATRRGRSSAGRPGQPFNVGKLANAKAAPFGIDLIRSNTSYEKSTLFAGYPAKRPWSPLANDVYQEDLPSAGDAYPYPIKIPFTYMSAMAYSLPAAHTGIEILCDPKRSCGRGPGEGIGKGILRDRREADLAAEAVVLPRRERLAGAREHGCELAPPRRRLLEGGDGRLEAPACVALLRRGRLLELLPHDGERSGVVDGLIIQHV
jgi:hypothetical protein